MKREISSRDWFGKVSAGLILGFLLALGISGLFRHSLGVEDAFISTKGQFAMWLISPIWAGILSFCFLFSSPRSAWGWLGLSSGIIWALLIMLGATI